MTEEETDIFLRLTTFPFRVQALILILFDGYDLKTVVREQSNLPSVTMSWTHLLNQSHILFNDPKLAEIRPHFLSHLDWLE